MIFKSVIFTSMLVLNLSSSAKEVSLSENFKNRHQNYDITKQNNWKPIAIQLNAVNKEQHLYFDEYIIRDYFAKSKRSPKRKKIAKIVGGISILGIFSYFSVGSFVISNDTGSNPSNAVKEISSGFRVFGVLSLMTGISASIPLFYRAKHPRNKSEPIEII